MSIVILASGLISQRSHGGHWWDDIVSDSGCAGAGGGAGADARHLLPVVGVRAETDRTTAPTITHTNQRADRGRSPLWKLWEPRN